MDTKIQTAVERIHQTEGFDLTALALVENEQNQCVLKWQYLAGNKTNRLRRIVLRSGKGIAGMVFKIGKPLLVPDVHLFSSSDQLCNFPIVSLEHLESLGAVPVWHNGRVVGVLLGGFREPNKFTQERLNQLQWLAKHAFHTIDGNELMLI